MKIIFAFVLSGALAPIAYGKSIKCGDALSKKYRLVDLDHDSNPEWIGTDYETFKYWHASGAESASIRVIFKCTEGKLVVAEKLMSRSPPTTETRKMLIKKLKLYGLGEELRKEMTPVEKRNLANYELPSDLWQFMIDMISSGQSEAASEFIRDAWPSNLPDKEKFLAAFHDSLKKSPMWRYIEKVKASETPYEQVLTCTVKTDSADVYTIARRGVKHGEAIPKGGEVRVLPWLGQYLILTNPKTNGLGWGYFFKSAAAGDEKEGVIDIEALNCVQPRLTPSPAH